ncbi:XIAP-associated factor 1 [Heterodontus francisci]|uniref:XIAP-associated factor 1 n=1 Tax=Heterodontus francisci TaxID=7792 RepID=UPI00355C6C8B
MMMKGEDEESTFCSNCKKDVATSNYRIHEIHCKRFIQLCPLCNDPVPTAELQTHRDTEHQQVKCSLCHKTMEHCKLETHKDEECAQRLLSCCFCELETPCCTLLEHEEACGSRTTRCSDCGKYVMYRDQELHGEICPSVQSTGQGESSEIPCEFCTKMFPEDELPLHQDGCKPLSDLVRRFHPSLHQDLLSYHSSTSHSRPSVHPFLSPLPPQQFGARPLSSPWRSAFAESEDLDEIGSCPVCDCALPYELLKHHEAKCRFFDQQRKMAMSQNPINENTNP